MSSVLVLNQDYTPITTCSVERAFLLLYMEKAEILSKIKNKTLRSISQTFPYPSVIKINKYINIPYKGVILTRHNVFKRDGHKCQYCGSLDNLTLDHLVPRSKGGKSTWTNLVTACSRCNSRKGDFTPEEVGLKLKNLPFRPSYIAFMRAVAKEARDDWKPFLERKYSA